MDTKLVKKFPWCFKWDSTTMNDGLEFPDDTHKVIKSVTGGFQNAYSNKPIPPNRVTTFALKVRGKAWVKVGVTSNKQVERCFANHDSGWAYFPIKAETRHASGESGTKIFQDDLPMENIKVTAVFDRRRGHLDFAVNEGITMTQEHAFADSTFADKDQEFWAAISIHGVHEITVEVDGEEPWERGRKCATWVQTKSELGLTDNLFREMISFI